MEDYALSLYSLLISIGIRYALVSASCTPTEYRQTTTRNAPKQEAKTHRQQYQYKRASRICAFNFNVNFIKIPIQDVDHYKIFIKVNNNVRI